MVANPSRLSVRLSGDAQDLLDQIIVVEQKTREALSKSQASIYKPSLIDKSEITFRANGKVETPRYITIFKIPRQGGKRLPYRLELNPEKTKPVFNIVNCHVSKLFLPVWKCLSDEPLAIPLDEIHIDEKLNFIEEPVEIMDREVKRLKQSRIPIVKVRWNSRRGPEYTWEREDQMQKKYPHLFPA
ncbi:hypothetical protein Tco_0610964 [Tanacetum coccineum]